MTRLAGWRGARRVGSVLCRGGWLQRSGLPRSVRRRPAREGRGGPARARGDGAQLEALMRGRPRRATVSERSRARAT